MYLSIYIYIYEIYTNYCIHTIFIHQLIAIAFLKIIHLLRIIQEKHWFSLFFSKPQACAKILQHICLILLTLARVLLLYSLINCRLQLKSDFPNSISIIFTLCRYTILFFIARYLRITCVNAANVLLLAYTNQLHDLTINKNTK